MKVRSNVPVPSVNPYTRIRKFFFHHVKHGDSVWFKTENERNSARGSFGQWKRKTKTTLTCISKKVDDKDPDGPGFRMWFIDPAKIEQP